MEIYKFTKLDNEDILLQKIIIDNTIYTIINKENGDKLLKKISNINITDIKDIKEYDFKKSIILECLIENKEFNKLKYKSILEHIYKIINDGTKIIKHTKLNIKTVKKEDEGFYYLEFQKRPLKFRRDYKLDAEIKDINPINSQKQLIASSGIMP